MRIDVEALMRPARDALRGIPEIKWFLQGYEDVILDPANNEGHRHLLDTVFDGEGGLIDIAGDLYVIYIAYIRKELTDKYRFHVTECKKIKEMREEKRFKRYILTRNTSGIFKMFPDHEPQYEAALDVCKFCRDALKKVDREKYRKMWSIFKRDFGGRFDIATFFEIYGSKVSFASAPVKTDSSTSLQGGYTPSWRDISRHVREMARWSCQICGADLSTRRDLLHVHHKDGDKQNNSPSNLIALCAECHKAQPGHGRMEKIEAEDIEYIRRARARMQSDRR